MRSCGARRLTDDALEWLLNARPHLYESESTIWADILDGEFGEGRWYEGERGYVFSESGEADAMNAADPRMFERANHADAEVALPFYDNAGWGTDEVFDARFLAYVTHIHMHRFIIHRWLYAKGARSVDGSIGMEKKIRAHWFAGAYARHVSGRAVYQSNAAGRLWWLAHMSGRTAESMGRAAILDRFCRQVDLYHEPMSRSVFHNPETMAAFMQECPENTLTTAGVQAACKLVNSEATGRMLDALPYAEKCDIINGILRHVMKSQANVSRRGSIEAPRRITVLSLGAGVQSTVMALMAARGLLEGRPDFAIFADTKWESPAVYEHLKWLEGELERLKTQKHVLPPNFTVMRTGALDLRANIMRGTDASGTKFLEIPAYTSTPDGRSAGMNRRECTSTYKIKPIQQAVRAHLGLKKGEQVPWNMHVDMWLGISTDESVRQKPSQKAWITHRYPLIDQGMSRRSCKKWFDENYPDRHLPRSSCIGCPYKNDREWAELKSAHPRQFEDACEVDDQMRQNAADWGAGYSMPYLHRSRVPLREAVFDTSSDTDVAIDAECEGMCGV